MYECYWEISLINGEGFRRNGMLIPFLLKIQLVLWALSENGFRLECEFLFCNFVIFEVAVLRGLVGILQQQSRSSYL